MNSLHKTEDTQIHVCFGVHDPSGEYSRMTGTAMASLLANTQEAVTIHLLHDATLNDKNRERFALLASLRGQTLYFYNLDELACDHLDFFRKELPQLTNNRLTIGTLYRLLLPVVLPNIVEKCIYLDSDIIVQMDIAKLWAEDTGGAVVAAVPEQIAAQGLMAPQPLCEAGLVRPEQHFNAGVLIVNIPALRDGRDLVREGVNVLRTYPQCISLDQDVLNYFFSEIYCPLPYHYNIFVDAARLSPKPKGVLQNGIYHFAASANHAFPTEDAFSRLWLAYLAQSPWLDDAYMLQLLHKIEIRMLSNQLLLWDILRVFRNREIVLCPRQQDADFIQKLPFAQDALLLPLAEPDEMGLQALKNDVCKIGSGKIFLIFSPYFDIYKACLQSIGLMYRHDFFDGRVLCFLPINGWCPVVSL